jgi:phenylpyruvate tautomerase PptA (4-oxalocrotonate tautomerase family)
MPLIELDTSCELAGAGKKQQLVGVLSRVVAEGTGKPEQYVMACVRDKVAMSMSGGAIPCALVTIKAIGGLTKAVNQGLAGTISQLLQKELAIPADRVYITFQELPADHWAWNGKTFG